MHSMPCECSKTIVIRHGLLYPVLDAACSVPTYYFLPASAFHDFGALIVGATIVLSALIGVLRRHWQGIRAEVAGAARERNTRAKMEVATASAKAHLQALEATHQEPAMTAHAAG